MSVNWNYFFSWVLTFWSYEWGYGHMKLTLLPSLTFPPLNLRVGAAFVSSRGTILPQKWQDLPTHLTLFTKIANSQSAQSVLFKMLLHGTIWQLISLKEAFEWVGRVKIFKNISHRRVSMKKHGNNVEKGRRERVADTWLVWRSEEFGQQSEQSELRGAVTKLQRLEETWTLCIWCLWWASANLVLNLLVSSLYYLWGSWKALTVFMWRDSKKIIELFTCY